MLARLPLLAVLAAPLAAQMVTSEATTPSLAEQLVTRALDDNRAHALLADLIAHAPKRLAGTPGMHAANAWALQAMREIGLENVRLEPVTVPHWIRGEVERLVVDGPGGEATHPITALGGSVATPVGGLCAEVLMVRSFEELQERAAEAKGKIVFFNRAMPRVLRNTFHGYRDAVPQRGTGAIEAAKVGGIAAIVRSVTTAIDDHPHTGAMRYEEGVAKVPAVAISTRGAEALAARLAAGEAVKVTVEVDCAMGEPVVGGNVVGEIVGSSHQDEIVVFGAHLDGWDTGVGAHDDGAGCVHCLEAARLLVVQGYKPARTLRIVLFANEENGLDGARAYPEAHADELAHHVAALETDNGGFEPQGFGAGIDAARRDALALHLAPLRDLGMGALIEGGGGADIGPLRAHGVPLFSLLVANHRYFDYHHSALDRLDAVNERELAMGGAALAFFATILTDPAKWSR